MKKLSNYLEEQTNIVAKAELAMLFLKVYKNNPKEFYMLFDENIISEIYGHKYNPKNIDEVYEFCLSLSEAIIEPNKQFFHMTSNGIFSYIEYSKKFDENVLNDIYIRFGPLASYAWGITSRIKDF